MRRSLAILFATATAIGASAATSSLSQAAPMPAPALTGSGAIEQVEDRYWGGGDWGHGHRRHHGHHRHHRHHGDYDGYGGGPGFSFNFGFPQAYYRPYYTQPYYGDCFRTWDGQLICS